MNERKMVLYPGVSFVEARVLNEDYEQSDNASKEGMHSSLAIYTVEGMEDCVVYQTKTQRVFRLASDWEHDEGNR